MYILGISGGFRAGNMDGAACLVRDNRIIAAAEEERFIRHKHAAGLIPLHASKYCLQEAGISIKNVDALVFAGATYTDIKSKLKRYFTFKLGFCPKVYLVEHHLAHAASAFFVSGFDRANILTMDLSGDGIATLLAFGSQRKITKIKEFTRQNSLGAYYNIITQYLGFNRNNDEYKVMGLAAYGKPVFNLSWLLKKTDEGYTFNQEAMVELKTGNPFPSMQEPVYSKKLLKKYQDDLKVASLSIEKLTRAGYQIKFDMNLPGLPINIKETHKVLIDGVVRVRNQAKRQIKKYLEKLRPY